MSKRFSLLFVFCAAILWGTTGTAQSFAPKGASPFVIGATRVVVGGPVLLFIAYLRRKLPLNHWKVGAIFMASLGVALYQPMFFAGVKMTGVAVGTVVAIGSAPILAGLLEWGWKRTFPKRGWWFATFVAIAGVGLLALQGEQVTFSGVGLSFALGAGFSFALYTLMMKRLLTNNEPEAVMGIVFTMSAIYLLPLFFLTSSTPLFSFAGVGVALYLGLIATALAYFIFSHGLIHVTASTAMTLSLAEPLTATLLGVFVVGESFTMQAWIGIFLLLIGLGLLAFFGVEEGQEQ